MLRPRSGDLFTLLTSRMLVQPVLVCVLFKLIFAADCNRLFTLANQRR